MAFDKTDFIARATEILTRLGEESYEFLELKPSRSDHWAEFRFLRTGDPIYVYAASMNRSASSKSSHRKLAEADYTRKREADIEALRKLIIDAIPALDHRLFHLDIELRSPSRAGTPRYRFGICHQQLASNPVQLPTIVKKLAEIAELLDGVGKPEGRTFLINGQTVPAVDAYAAVRVHSALAYPHIFTNPPATTPQVTVAEKLDPMPLFSPIFREVHTA